MEESVVIIGAGIAGLSAGCYCRMNGYSARIFEMHDKPGGLCTAWERKGYIIDGCLHWLVGSAPGNDLYRYWLELGMLQGKTVIDMEQFYRYESPDGHAFTMYCNIDRLEQHMKEISPQDGQRISELAHAMRHLAGMDMMMDKAPELQDAWDKVKMIVKILPYMNDLRKWAKMTIRELVSGFKSRLIRDAMQFWPQELSVMAFIFTVAWMHKKTAGYTIGGSMPLMRAVEERYTGLGGSIDYKSKVVKVLVENNRAVGVLLDSGEKHMADHIISAADGHAAIFDMLEGKYVDDIISSYYTDLPVFTPILYVSLGVNRTFNDVPQLISGLTIGLEKQVLIGNKEHKHLHVRINNFDPTLAPPGKSIITSMIDTDYGYWKELRKEPANYKEEKEKAAETVIRILEQRFPGLTGQIEMTDVATPVTFERYTGNWQGCYEGFLTTPRTQMLRMRKTLPGLDRFYMVGQWVSPGGGLPSGVMTGRHAAQILCKRDGKRFKTALPGER